LNAKNEKNQTIAIGLAWLSIQESLIAQGQAVAALNLAHILSYGISLSSESTTTPKTMNISPFKSILVVLLIGETILLFFVIIIKRKREIGKR
jgi:hypothetical protein